MITKLDKTDTRQWLRLGNGSMFRVTEGSLTADALKPQLGTALDHTDAINTGDLILLPITPYVYMNADNELSIANRVMLGDSLSHLRVAPSQRLLVYWIEDIEQALCAQVYFNNLLPAQLSDTRKQLAIIKRADGSELKRLNTVYGQELTDRLLSTIVNRPLKHQLDTVSQNDIQAYREALRETASVPTRKTRPKLAPTITEIEATTQLDTTEQPIISVAAHQPSDDHSTAPSQSSDARLNEFFSFFNPQPSRVVDTLAQKNWHRLGVEHTLKLTLPQLLDELSQTHTPVQVDQAEAVIKCYPIAANCDSITFALQLFDELSAQCGINTDMFKRRITERGGA